MGKKTLQMQPEYYISFLKELKDNAEKISNNYFYISHETIKNEDNFLDLCSSIDIEHKQIKDIDMMELSEALIQKLMKINFDIKGNCFTLVKKIEFKDTKIYIEVNELINIP